MKILIAILVFGIIIAIHEFGHFIAAKLCGVKVNEFAIGMGPAIFKKQKGETLYALRLLPIGGFCAMEGEDEESTDERAFPNKKTWQKVVILLAGAFMNIFLGFILVIIMTATNGDITSTTVSGFAKNATTSKSGLMVGDEIKKVNGMNIWVDKDIVYQLLNDKDGIVSMQVLRDGKKVQLDEVKFQLEQTNPEKQQIKIDFAVEPIERNFASVMSYSVKYTGYVGRLIWISLVDLISGKYGFNELSGPVGIVGTIGTAISMGETVAESLKYLINLTVFITINVGIFNLLPLPALDGGRIVCRLIEGISKKKIKAQTEGIIHFVGLALLMVLMLAVTFNDIVKIFQK
ncbi:MAG: site-2 protease family protein [Oscillospiraceae bacterium]